eukprot:gene6289-7011_t
MASCSKNIDDCESCMKQTKYICIICGIPVCTACSLEELDEDTRGWVACRSVGYCSACKYEQLNSIPSSNNSNNADEELDIEDDDTDDSPPAKKKKPNKKSGRKTTWPETLLNDFIDIIVSDEYLKKRLIFQNVKNQKNAEIYEKVLKELKKRLSARNEECNYTVIQLRNKFKKTVSECKKAALVMKTASGIKRFQEEKNYGAWFNQLFALVKTRESCQPDQAIEPGEQSLNSSVSGNSIDSQEDFFVPVKKDAKKNSSKEKQSQELLEIMKQLVQKDPMADFLKYAREQEERDRQHELALVKLLSGQQSMPSQPQPISYHQGYVNQPNHQQSSPNDLTYGLAGQGSSSLGSFMHELNDFSTISTDNITKL